MKATGALITFEGLDGCGKSTQLEKLASTLRMRGLEVVSTREPGGTEASERIRQLLLNSKTTGLTPLTELALMFAARAQHVEEVILPAMGRGAIVLSDRFTDSSEAYQGGGRQLGSEIVRELHRLFCHDLEPRLTILMDSDVAASIARARRRNQAQAGVDEARFEQEDRKFFERVRSAYLEIAKREPQRVVVIDARRPIEAVHREILTTVEERLHLPAPAMKQGARR
jgi:dTMP kinase